jgi:Fe-S oxidoreductase
MEGKLKPRNALPLRVAFHSSCYLGRYNNIYESPRALIASATGNPVLEMPRNHDRSFCCGAGGGRMWMEETEGEKINLIRTREGLETGANCLASACPYCLTMLSDGVKAENREDVVTKDIAEILLESLV